ncbi:MAG: hypothetical protein JJT94_10755 [Bernardetiaceae bacterium]|nr:hypothetical protein [Bernardetiaceae bacterium]
MQAKSSLWRCNWIVSPRYDLLYFIGSCVVTLFFLAIYLLLDTYNLAPRGETVLVTYFIFTAIFDHPHIFQMFSRTHYDKEERARRPFLYSWGIVLFIVIGLICMFFGLESELIVLAAFFGSWHVIRQHSGFLKAYKGINKDYLKIDKYLDNCLFYTGMFACFFRDYTDIKSPIEVYKNLQAHFPYLPVEIAQWLWSIFLVCLVLFVFRQIWHIYKGHGINLPKILFLTAALGTHYFVFFWTAVPFLIAEALETAYHNIQYQGFMMHYQRRRFPKVKKIATKWFAVAMLYGLLVGVIEVISLMNHDNMLKFLFVPFSMLVLYHYYVDGLIWKFGKDPELRQAIFDKK